MNFTKSILLGSATALLAVASASSADLPSKKSAPVEYAKVCSAYGTGFFFIPGTDTCLKIGGRVRADYAYVPAMDQFSGANALGVGVVNNAKDSANTLGWEARGRIEFDARTNTAFGTVQSAAGLRLARSTGSQRRGNRASSSDLEYANSGLGYGASSSDASTALEYAYVRFAGFTFGAAGDNFAFMPSLTYGAGHWGSFANGAKQIAYTATFGGGVSATIALQDHRDTSVDNLATSFGGGSIYNVYNTAPQVNANIRFDQSWGAIQLMGAYNDVSVNTATDGLDYNKGIYAIGAGLKINLPMLAKGDALYLTANYANGMTEYTTNWTSFKSSANSRDVGGYTMNHLSNMPEPTGIESVKSWNIAALLEHYWAPEYRSVVFGSYGQLDAPNGAKARAWTGYASFGDATVWNVGTNFAWLPARNFEIGVEVIYAGVNQNVRSAITAGNSTVFSKSDSNVTGRLRVERNF
jgi:hypothetical protein